MNAADEQDLGQVIPRSLQERDQWVCWQMPMRHGKGTKFPVNPYNGGAAKSTDRSTWSSFAIARKAWAADQKLRGVGFVFDSGDPFCGVDLDNCIDSSSGRLKPWAAKIVQRLNSYTEISPSGKGLKIFVQATKPGARCKAGHEDGAIEMYDHDRFFTVTGRQWAGTSDRVEARQEQIEQLYHDVFAAKAARQSPPTSTSALSDEQIIEKASRSHSGAKFQNLWLGRWAGTFPSQSEADSSLMFMLAFYTKDAGQLDRLFRRSCLMRDKWDEKHGARTYGQMTIDRALEKVTEHYRPGGCVSNGAARREASVDDAVAGVEPWPAPQPLPTGLPPVPTFKIEWLPLSLRGWIADITNRMQSPVDYCATVAMTVAGALIGRKVAIRPKRQDDWQVVPNLWALNVGRPSSMKTPSTNAASAFLRKLEVEAKAEYAAVMESYQASQLLGEATRKVKAAELKSVVKEGGNAAALAEELAKSSFERATPVRKRYLTQDTSMEKCGVLLAENPNGIVLGLDEAGSWLRTMNREGHEGDRGFYLTAWAGDSRYTFDRIGRGTIDVEAAIVSIIANIQPGVLQEHLRQAVGGGAGDDGLLPRFQLAVWPDLPSTWTNVDQWPDADAKEIAYSALDRLAKLTADNVGAERDRLNEHALPFLRFDSDAQDLFDRWRSSMENHLRTAGEHPCIESHLAKYRSLIPSLALITHLLEGGAGPVPVRSLECAIEWSGYLEAHARRLYAGVTRANVVSAIELARRIRSGEVVSGFDQRTVYRNCWQSLDKEQTGAAVELLMSLDWLREHETRTSGRTKIMYTINPQIQKEAVHAPAE